MKNRLILLLVAFLMLATLPLQAGSRQEYTLQQLQEKVQKMEVLQWDKMPTLFIYTERLDWYDNQADINVFYKAQKMWKNNPNNFAAVFNYGLLIMSNDYGEGVDLGPIQIDEAYRVLEQAKKLRSDYKEIYELQLYLLDYKLFGPSWGSTPYSEGEMIAIYRAHPDLARKQLLLLKTMFKKWNKEVSAWNYDQASLICSALNLEEEAQAYQKKAELMDQQEAAAQAAKKREQKETQKSAFYSIREIWRNFYK